MAREGTQGHWAVVPAAGSGSRMRAALPKQYLVLEGRTVLAHTLARLAAHPGIAGIAVALSPDDERFDALDLELRVPLLRVPGGAERAHSVLNALEILAARPDRPEWVLVHDAARPCLRRDDLERLIREATAHPVGGVLGVPVRDTMKRAGAGGEVRETVERRDLWHALTPQMFRLDALRGAYRDALARGVVPTDEAMAMEQTGKAPRLVEGSADNLKITRPEDLALAAFHLRAQVTAGEYP